MNRYLLDTHIILWWLYDDPKLSKVQRNIIQDSQNEIFVSSASVWEIEIKRNLGKLIVDDAYFKAIEDDGFIFLKIEPYHSLGLRELPDIHNDPFDRMLIAQAISEKMVLISRDAQIKRYDLKVI